MTARATLVTLDAVEASDSGGFVGLVRVGAFEAYRTMRAYATPGAALDAVQDLLGGSLGTLMAGQEWREASAELGHIPLRAELGLIQGPKARRGRAGHDGAEPPHP